MSRNSRRPDSAQITLAPVASRSELQSNTADRRSTRRPSRKAYESHPASASASLTCAAVQLPENTAPKERRPELVTASVMNADHAPPVPTPILPARTARVARAPQLPAATLYSSQARAAANPARRDQFEVEVKAPAMEIVPQAHNGQDGKPCPGKAAAGAVCGSCGLRLQITPRPPEWWESEEGKAKLAKQKADAVAQAELETAKAAKVAKPKRTPRARTKLTEDD